VPTPSLSQHAVIARPSPTLGISAKAAAMKAKGLDVISLSVGEPDFNTPEPIRSAAIAAMNEGLTKYTPSTGLPKLKQAVAKKFTEENGFAVEPSDVVITVGAKHAIFNALWVTVGPGDEVILLAPYWMTYLDQVNLCGAKAKVVMSGPESGYIPSIEDIKAAITPNTKALLLNSPSNPTGAVYPPELIRQIAELAVEHNFWLISDEIYEKLIYDDAKLLSPASISPDVQERTITVNGCSKTFSMTGWRIGYLTGPTSVVKSISNFQDQVTSNPTSFAQIGALAALEMDPELVEGMRIEFDKRRKFAAELLRQIPNLGVIEPKGAFYFFLDMSKFLGKEVADDTALCDKFLEEAHVAMVPGSVFEGPGCMRMSYAVSMEQLEKGISRMAEVLSRF
jgi:aspartate aminotransferase